MRYSLGKFPFTNSVRKLDQSPCGRSRWNHLADLCILRVPLLLKTMRVCSGGGGWVPFLSSACSEERAGILFIYRAPGLISGADRAMPAPFVKCINEWMNISDWMRLPFQLFPKADIAWVTPFQLLVVLLNKNPDFHIILFWNFSSFHQIHVMVCCGFFLYSRQNQGLNTPSCGHTLEGFPQTIFSKSLYQN